MTLGEKIRYLRMVEGNLRGLGRAMTQVELVEAVRETGGRISQSYLSQIEHGTRPHLTNKTRTLLARFFKVHPGYLVTDPPGYHEELTSPLKGREDSLDVWLWQGVERFGKDGALQRALHRLASAPNSREWLLMLGEVLGRPGTLDRFKALLRAPGAETGRKGGRR